MEWLGIKRIRTLSIGLFFIKKDVLQKEKRREYSAISPNNAFLCTNNNKEVYYDLIFLL